MNEILITQLAIRSNPAHRRDLVRTIHGDGLTTSQRIYIRGLMEQEDALYGHCPREQRKRLSRRTKPSWMHY